MPRRLIGPGNPHTLLKPDARACPKCAKPTHPWEDIGDIHEPIEADFSTTFDMFPVVSQKFRDVVTRAGVQDVAFIALSNGSFLIRPQRTVFMDMSEKLLTKGPCWTCGRFTSFVGDTRSPSILPGQKPIAPNDVLRSAQTFVGSDYQTEHLIFGEGVFEALTDEGLRGGAGWYFCPQDA